MPFRLAILETHPIQYKAPWFRALHVHPDVDLTVLYGMIPDAQEQGRGFGVSFQWDIPLLEGYRHELLENVARRPGLSHFSGCDTPGLGRAIARGAYDAVIINGWVVKSCLQGLWACRCRGVPAILRCEANDLRPRAAWRTLVHRVLLKQFSAFIAIGRSNRDFYVNRGVDPARIVDGFYCVENERFGAACPRLPRDELRRQWGIPRGATCFLFCGKFESKKRPLDVLGALARLVASCPHTPQSLSPASERPRSSHSAHLLMVGDGELREESEVYASERGLPVTFAGFLNQTQLPGAYAAADCLVLPSDYGETWGLVVNEAMACGLPALVSDRVGCHPDLIVAGNTGSVFAFGDVRALSVAMQRVADDPQRLRTMGAAAHEHIQAYSIARLVDGTLAALRIAVGAG